MKNAMYNKALFTLFALLPMTIFAQEEIPMDQPVLFSDLMSYILAGLVVLVGVSSIYVIYKTLDFMIRLKEISIYEKHGLTEYLHEKKANEGSWWQKMSRNLTAAVPIEKEEEILFDHDYDGIRELDNNLPPWWVYGFYLTIVIAIVYMGVYHFSSFAKSSEELYAIEMEEAQKDVEAYLAKQADAVDESNVEFLTDEASLAEGKEIFTTLCVACHLESGGGSPVSVGPNLTDKYWLHGGSIQDIFKTIKYGVPEKGMISWRSQIRPADMQKVSSYILSLQGTNPPDAKEPQGELYEADKMAGSEEIISEGIETDL
jgi:cytochrome c oxidase cbb3-type subunit 3